MTTALLVIDVQRIYTDAQGALSSRDASKTVARINELIHLFETKKQPIFYVRHQHRKNLSDIGHLFNFDGGEVEAVNFLEGSEEVEYDRTLRLVPNRIEIVKTRYSAFVGTKLDRALRANNITQLVIVGFMTNFCCESTARSALDLDYFVDVVIDATGTPGTDNYSQADVRRNSAEILKAGFARVFTTKQYLRKGPNDVANAD